MKKLRKDLEAFYKNALEPTKKEEQAVEKD
jgi:hypothetical protein